MTADDFTLMHEWLNNPEVAAWYGLGMENRTNPTLEEVIEDYSPRMRGESPTLPYTMRIDGRRIGYIQCYRIGDWPPYAAVLGMDDDAWAIDLFIGEDDMRGRGLGATILARFVRHHIFIRDRVTTCIVSPNPMNKRGISCYEKAAFEYVKTVFVEHEQDYEYVMVLSKAAS